MQKLFRFGEEVPGYDYRVINERDARASAGIMFLFGIISFFSFILTHNLFWAEVFSLTFILEFAIRVLINPLYAPYMVLGSVVVSNQHPDWVEAKPKKFAWILGLGLGLIMAYFIVFGILSPIRMLTCVACLILLYVESVFGICLGCILYQKLNVDVQNCPGGVCEAPPARRGSRMQKVAVLSLFALVTVGMYQTLKVYKYHNFQPQLSQTDKEDLAMMIEGLADKTPTEKETTPGVKSPKTKKLAVAPEADKADAKDCTVPQWAVAMGHREMWLEHHGCK